MSMYFDSWTGFLAMEGHGLYVWSAYAIAVAVIAYNLMAPFLAKRRVVAQVKRNDRLIKRQVIVNDVKAPAASGHAAAKRSANAETIPKKRVEPTQRSA